MKLRPMYRLERTILHAFTKRTEIKHWNTSFNVQWTIVWSWIVETLVIVVNIFYNYLSYIQVGPFVHLYNITHVNMHTHANSV